MAEMLQQGHRFPSMTLTLTGGETLRIPDDVPTPYAVVIFYRGHW